MLSKKFSSVIIFSTIFLVIARAEPSKTPIKGESNVVADQGKEAQGNKLAQLYEQYANLQTQILQTTDKAENKSLKQKLNDIYKQILELSKPASNSTKIPGSKPQVETKETRQQTPSHEKQNIVEPDCNDIDAITHQLYKTLAQAKRDFDSVIEALFHTIFLNQPDTNTYQHLMSLWLKKLNKGKILIESLEDNKGDEKLLNLTKSYLKTLSNYARSYVFAYFLLQPLIIDKSDTLSAPLKKAYSPAQLQKLMLKLWGKINQSEKHDTIHAILVDELLSLLPDKVIGSFISRAIPIIYEDQKALYNLIAFVGPTLMRFHEASYLSCMKDYHNSHVDSETKMRKVNTLIKQFEDLADSKFQPVYTLFTPKLYSMKKDLTQEKKLENLTKNHPEKVDLFIKYTSLATQKKIEDLIEKLTPIIDYGYACYGHDEEKEDELKKFFTDYTLAVEKYFNQDTYDTQLLLSAGSLKYQLIDIKKDYDRSYFLFGVVGSHKVVKNLQTFIEIISTIESHVKKLLDLTSTQSIWQSLTGNKEVLLEKIKSTKGLSSLIHASPLLGIALLKYVSPHVNSNLKNRILAFLGTQPEKKPSKDHLLDFLKNNPEVAQELIKQKPEFSDMLIEKFKTLSE